MGNSTQTTSAHNEKKKTVNFEQINQMYDKFLHQLSVWCNKDQYPLNLLNYQTDATSRHRIIEIISSPRRSDEFSRLLVELIFKNRNNLSKDDLTKLFQDICFFDLKQALTDDSKITRDTLDKDCFSALNNSIFTSAMTVIGEEHFYQWIRTHFITIFYAFEMWLRKNCEKTNNTNSSHETSSSKHSMMPMNNILNPTWVWLLTHQLSILYLSADNSCTNLFERMGAVLHGRMWDHLYDSHRDGASLNRFQHHVFGYKAPTLMLFETSDGYLFCLCCDEEFRESSKHFGGIQACLLQLKPVFKIVIEGPRIIFMNTKLRGVSSLGLFIGRDHTHTFLDIDSDFFNIKHLNGQGRLLAIDVWGAGSKKSAEEQHDMRQWEDKQVEKSRKVKRSYEEEEMILNMAGIETRHTQDQF